MRFSSFNVSKSHQLHSLPRRPSHRRFAVQSLEKRELLAGDLTFTGPYSEPYRVIEGKAIVGRIDIGAAVPTGSPDLVIQLKLAQSSEQASLSFFAFAESFAVTVAAGESVSDQFLVKALVDGVADGNEDVRVTASLAGYNDLIMDIEILDAEGGNASPEIVSLAGLGFVNAALPGDAVSITGNFADADAADVHQVTVDWGDGTSEVLTASQVDQVSDSFNAAHVYATPGLYDVSVTVTDSADSDTSEARAAIVGVTLSDDDVVQVVGASGADRVEVRKARHGRLYIAARFEDFGKQYRSFKVDDVESLSIITGPGRDHVRVQPRVKMDAVIRAGAGADVVQGGGGNTTVIAGAGNDVVVTRGGNDKLIGGRGDDVLSAGSGDDIVRGGPGFNVLVGGRGVDRLVTAGEDIVIGGILRQEARVCKLAKLMDYWNSGDAFQDRVDAIVDEFIHKRKGHHGHHRRGFVMDDKQTDTFRNVEPAQRQWFFADKNEVTGADSQDIVS